MLTCTVHFFRWPNFSFYMMLLSLMMLLSFDYLMVYITDIHSLHKNCYSKYPTEQNLNICLMLTRTVHFFLRPNFFILHSAFEFDNVFEFWLFNGLHSRHSCLIKHKESTKRVKMKWISTKLVEAQNLSQDESKGQIGKSGEEGMNVRERERERERDRQTIKVWSMSLLHLHSTCNYIWAKLTQKVETASVNLVVRVLRVT